MVKCALFRRPINAGVRTLGWGVVLIAALAWTVEAALAGAPELEQRLRSRLQPALADPAMAGPLAGGGGGAGTLAAVYRDRDYAPLWATDTAAKKRAQALVTALRQADREGLNPRAYGVDRLTGLLDARQPDRLMALELGLSAALLAYAEDLRHGRLTPELLDTQPPATDRDTAPAKLLTGAATAESLPGFLANLAPANPDYRRLRRALTTYRGFAAEGPWPQVPAGQLLKPGMRDPTVAILRQRLQRSRDLTIDSDDPELFDPALEQAVRRFQARHGVEPDGIVGPNTRRELNVPLATRIRQIEVNMARWRWMPDDLGQRYILVNLAGFEVSLVEAGSVRLHQRAVVGRPYRRTPVFSDRVTYLEFNPTWTVPPTIAKKDVLPKAAEDPGYFESENMTVYRGWSAEAPKVDPTAVDWSTVDPARIPYRFVQAPGPENVLGRVKFMFPNRYHVYLHDTPQRGLFAKAQRDFSSGCIRVEKAREMAAILLEDVPGWDRARIDSVIAAGKTTRVRLPDHVPIHLSYATAWVGEGGTIHFGQDIYGRDVRLEQALSAVEATRAPARPAAALETLPSTE